MTCDDHVTRGPFATAWRHGERSICCEFPAWKNFVSFLQHPSTVLWKYMEIHVAKDTFMMTLTHWLRLGNVGNPTPGGIMQPPDIPDIIGLGCDRTPIESAAQKCSKSKRRATFRIFGNEHLHESFWRWDEEFSLRFSPSDPPCLGNRTTLCILTFLFYDSLYSLTLHSGSNPLWSHCKGNTFKILQVKFDKNIDKHRHCHSHHQSLSSKEV